MTLGNLIDKWMVEIKNLSPENVIPNKLALAKEAVRSIVRACGGIHKNIDINLVSGTSLYSLPDDYYKCHYATLNNIRLKNIDVTKTIDSTTGTPSAYYLYGSKVGFYPCPNDSYTVKFYYWGLGVTDNTGKDDTILSEINMEDSDSFWKAVIFYMATEYFRLNDEIQKAEYYNILLKKARWEARKSVTFNMEHIYDESPADLLDTLSGKVINERFGNEGDTFKTW